MCVWCQWESLCPGAVDSSTDEADAPSYAAADAIASETTSGSSGNDSTAEADDGAPKPGDVVEYPLSDIVIADMCDGRTHGVALLVGRNMDR